MRYAGWKWTYNPNTDSTPNGGSLPTSYTIILPQRSAVSELLKFDYDIPTFKTTSGYKRDTKSKIIERTTIVNHSGTWIFQSSSDLVIAMDIVSQWKGYGGTLVAEEVDSAGTYYNFNPTAILQSCIITRKSQVDEGNWRLDAKFTFYLEKLNWTTNLPPTSTFPTPL